jgi:hypothetical protein
LLTRTRAASHSLVEEYIGIICACLPCLKAFSKHFFPGLFLFSPAFEQRVSSSFPFSSLRLDTITAAGTAAGQGQGQGGDATSATLAAGGGGGSGSSNDGGRGAWWRLRRSGGGGGSAEGGGVEGEKEKGSVDGASGVVEDVESAAAGGSTGESSVGEGKAPGGATVVERGA